MKVHKIKHIIQLTRTIEVAANTPAEAIAGAKTLPVSPFGMHERWKIVTSGTQA